jgi:hypothetical protein
MGYDGVIVSPDGTAKNATEIVVFDGTQLKSALEQHTDPGTVMGFKQAVPEAVGKMTPERIQSIKISHDDGTDRIFNYEKGFSKKFGQEMWLEMKDRALKTPANDAQLELPVDTVETKIDNSFNEAKKRITSRDQFEGHVAPETKAALEHADEAFKEANKLNKIYETITACLR